MTTEQQPKYYLERYDDYDSSGGTGDMEGPFNTVEQYMEAAKNMLYDRYTILKVEHNMITPYLWLHHNEWVPVEPVPTPVVLHIPIRRPDGSAGLLGVFGYWPGLSDSESEDET